MIEYVILIIILIYFAIASFEDIKKREVYDYLTYSLAFIVAIIGIFDSILTGSIRPTMYVIFGLVLGFVIGSIIYFLGIWGGGDLKFLIGFSGAGFYLIEISGIFSRDISQMFTFIISNYSIQIGALINNLVLILIFLNIFSLIYMLWAVFVNLEKKRILGIIELFVLFIFLTLGLVFNEILTYLGIFSFLAFLIVFFSDENMLFSSYFIIKRQVRNLSEGDRIDNIIIVGKNKVEFKHDVEVEGLSLDDLSILKDKAGNDFEINKRVLPPFGHLIALNFLFLIILIIGRDEVNLSLFSFLLEYLIISFIAGGILAIFIIFYFFLMNFKNTIFAMKKYKTRIYLFSILFVISMFIMLYFKIEYYYLAALLGIYLFIYVIFITKEVESFAFVKKKSIFKIVPGDWVVEDVYVKDKVMYKKEDFKLGISQDQIDAIKKLDKNLNYPKELLVKDGIAFLPPLFIGFLIIIIF